MIMFIQKFINRKRELNFLRREHQKPKPFFIVLYGRRRVGKTELIKQFIKDQKAVYLLSTQEVEKENVVSFSEELADFFGDYSVKINPFSDFKQIMEYLKSKLKEIRTKTIIVFDEFPYLVDANNTIPSLLQKYWDQYFKESNLGFILCGSSIGAMESEVLGHKSPLYGRRSGQWKVNLLLFKDVIKFFPSLDFKSQMELYSVVGGIPLYLLEMDSQLSVIKNVNLNIARKGAFLYEEPIFILKEELREPKIYFSLLKEIAAGKIRLNDLKNALGVERTLLGRYIETLETLDLIEKQIPVTVEPRSKNTCYFMKDNFFRFWFKFIFPYRKNLEMNENKEFLDNLKRNFNVFMGFSFEQICTEFLLRQQDLLFNFTKIGRQWGKFKGEPGKNNYEIDICGLNEKEKKILFGECKWKDKVNAYAVLNQLKKKVEYVDWFKDDRKEYYCLFAKSFKEKIQEKNVYLFDLKDLEKVFIKKK